MAAQWLTAATSLLTAATPLAATVTPFLKKKNHQKSKVRLKNLDRFMAKDKQDHDLKIEMLRTGCHLAMLATVVKLMPDILRTIREMEPSVADNLPRMTGHLSETASELFQGTRLTLPPGLEVPEAT